MPAGDWQLAQERVAGIGNKSILRQPVTGSLHGERLIATRNQPSDTMHSALQDKAKDFGTCAPAGVIAREKMAERYEMPSHTLREFSEAMETRVREDG